MECASVSGYTLRFEVVLFEGGCFPRATVLETDEMGEVSLESKYTHDASISAVKSVSGFTVDVLKFVPFSTVNH